MADLLLWQELPTLLNSNQDFQQSLQLLQKEEKNDCKYNKQIIATNKWYFAAQLEYNQILSVKYKTLNLDT